MMRCLVAATLLVALAASAAGAEENAGNLFLSKLVAAANKVDELPEKKVEQADKKKGKVLSENVLPAGQVIFSPS